ncbi:hypothetical protein [Pseudonocardia sp. GCM10023141]|uniref:hypothetical protein n=1 Tax=Pseudonocardia sp. GCM10023141 TaxID=3252653 RepID=UPI0036216808
MRAALVLAGSTMAVGACAAMASALMLRPPELGGNRTAVLVACWLFAGALVVMLPAFVLRHRLRGPDLPERARAYSAAAHTVFATGCLIGLWAAVLRLDVARHIQDRAAEWVSFAPVTAQLRAMTVLFGLGLILDAGFVRCTLRTHARTTAAAAIAGGLVLIVAPVTGIDISRWVPFGLSFGLGLGLLARGVDPAPAGRGRFGAATECGSAPRSGA